MTNVFGSFGISLGAVCAVIGTLALSIALNKGLINGGIARGFSIAKMTPVGGSPSLSLKIGCIRQSHPASFKTSSKSVAYLWVSGLSVIAIITILPLGAVSSPRL